MNMKLDTFIQRLNSAPDSINFDDTMTAIDSSYDFSPTAFKNGALINKAGENNGSCKLFSFAKLNNLSKQQTLNCFGAYYRDDVLKHPDANNHQNIRTFIKTGWDGIVFDSTPLIPKNAG